LPEPLNSGEQIVPATETKPDIIEEPPVVQYEKERKNEPDREGVKEDDQDDIGKTSQGGRKSAPSSTPSIRDALRSLVKKNHTANDEPSREEMENMPDEFDAGNVGRPVSPGELSGLWSSYVEKLKTLSPRIFLALSSQNPLLLDDGLTIRISFPNNTMQAEFKLSFKAPLLEFLREKLNNQSVQFEEIIPDPDSSLKKKYYTNLDKLKHMAEKNPALQKLRQDFNLDFE
jgi:DNA polymerase III subunit gamma/tau